LSLLAGQYKVKAKHNRSREEAMKVTRIETLRCDAGWRMFSFLKVMTDDGLIGWSPRTSSSVSSPRCTTSPGAQARSAAKGVTRHVALERRTWWTD
jgi:hypothetical protein